MAAFYNVAPFNHRRPDMFQCLSRTVISLPESPGDGSPSAFNRGSRIAAASTSFLLQTLSHMQLLYQTQPREDNTEIPESYAQNIRWSFLIDGRDVGTDVSYVSARSVGK